MRVPIVIWPCRVFKAPVSRTHFPAIAVELIDSRAPTKTPSLVPAPVTSLATPHNNIVNDICVHPPQTATPRIWRSFDALNSSPRPNKRNMTPNCAKVSTCTNSTISPRPPGPISEPASKYPVMTGCPSKQNNVDPNAAEQNKITKSWISLRSCCNSIVPLFGFEITNSLSEESTSLSTSSASPLPVRITLSMPRDTSRS
mmetsp:Transcript_2024/g.7897  ORF Transcript_2024/g.7897 Transcript_2024/m.7897 type:complete len:200 (-) Transcript_2024:139-738(-)